MIDVVAGAVLAFAVMRGWMRGLVREVISLAVILVGTIASFRFSGVVGEYVTRFTGTNSDISRLIGGVIVFVIISTAAAFVGSMVHRALQVVPGATTLNRFGGAALAFVAVVVLATVLLSVASLLPLPRGIADEIDSSRTAQLVTNPDGVPQAVMDLVSGDQVLSVILRINDLVGSGTTIGDPGPRTVDLGIQPGGEARIHKKATEALFKRFNELRVTEGVDPLARSSGLDSLAEAMGLELYDRAVLSHRGADGSIPRGRLDAAGIASTVNIELLAVGSSVGAIIDVWHDEQRTLNDATLPELRRVGVAIIDGDAGRLAVLVATG